ncbi:MAG: hypothetical protein JWM95_1732 [Gemmatimonadetes bacterium]|nr:hypothetical protein [Gemmatimonadota bacterium]
MESTRRHSNALALTAMLGAVADGASPRSMASSGEADPMGEDERRAARNNPLKRGSLHEQSRRIESALNKRFRRAQRAKQVSA